MDRDRGLDRWIAADGGFVGSKKENNHGGEEVERKNE
jgi:hypothetical protein